MSYRPVLAFVFAAFLTASAAAQPATNTWIGTASGNWSNAANWDANGVPLSQGTTVIQFNNSGSSSYTATQDMAAAFQLNGMVFNSSSSSGTTVNNAAGDALSFGSNGATGPFVFQNNSGAATIGTAGTVTFTAGATFGGGGAGGLTVSSPVVLQGSALTFAGLNTTTISGTISLPSSPLTITTNGIASGLLTGIASGSPTSITISAQPNGFTGYANGYVQLSGVNTFTGPVNLQSGVLGLGGTAPLGNAANVLTITGGALRASAAATVANPIAMSGTDLVFVGTTGATLNGTVGVSGTSGLQVLGTGALTINNTANFNGATTVGVPGLVSGSMTIGSTATTNGSLLNTTGITVNTAAASTTAGTLNLTNATANSSSRLSATTPITLDGARLNYTAGAGANAQSFGNLTVNGFGGVGTVAAGTGTTLTFGSLNLPNNATVGFRGPIVGTGGSASNTVVTFANGPFTGLAPAGSPTPAVIPWAAGFSGTNGNTNSVNSLVTPDGNGVRVLSVATSGNADFNVVGSAGTLAADQNNLVSFSGTGTASPAAIPANTTLRVNSLVLSFSPDSAIGSPVIGGNPGSVLRVYSGAIVASNSVNITVPTIDFGTHTGYIYPSATTRINGSMTGSGGLVISGYAGSGAGTFTVLSNANPFTGGLTINGTVPVQFMDDAALGAAGGSVTLGGGTLSYFNAGPFTFTRPIVLTPAGGGIQATGPNGIQSLINLNAGLVSGTGPLTLTSGGVLALSGTAGGTWSTNVNGGTLQFTGDGNFGSGPITLNGGTLQPTTSAAFTRALRVNSTSAIDVGSQSLFFTGPISTLGYTATAGSPPGLAKAGTGTLFLTADSPFVGPFTVAAGTVVLSGPNGRLANAIASTASTYNTVFAGATLELDNRSANNNDRYNGPVVLGGGSFVLLGNSAGTSETVGTLSSTAAGSTVTIAPATGAAATLTVSNLSAPAGNTLVVRGTGLGGTGANSSQLLVTAAPTQVNGILPGIVGDTSATGGGSFLATYSSLNGLVPATLTPAGGTIGSTPTANLLASGATTAAGTAAANSLTLAPGTSLTSGGSTLTLTSGMMVSQAGTASLVDGNTTVASTAGTGLTIITAGDLTVNGLLNSASGALAKLGAGNLTLANNLALTGTLTAGAGTVSLAASGAATGLAGTGAVDVSAGNTLSLTGPGNAFFGTLSGAGGLLRTATATGTQVLAGSITMTGPIQTLAGTLSLRSNVPAAATPIVIGDTTTTAGATLDVAPGVTISRDVDFASTQSNFTTRFLTSVSAPGTSVATAGQAPVTFAGAVILDSSVNLATNNATINMTGPVSGGGGISIGGGTSGAGGTVNLTNPNNTFAGGVTLNAQGGQTSMNTVLGVGAAGALGSGTITLSGSNSNTTVGGGGYLQALNGPQSVSNPVVTNPTGPGGTVLGLAGTNSLTLASVDTTLANLVVDNHSSNGSVLTITNLTGNVVGGLTNVTFGIPNGQISNFALPITPAGNVVSVGTLAHGGTTTVTGGVLQITGTATDVDVGGNPAGPITVAKLGTLAGTGTIKRNTEVAGTIAPGTGGASGTLSFTTPVVMDAGSKYSFSFAAVTGLSPGDNYNTIASTSTLDLSGVTAANPVTVNINRVGTVSSTSNVTYTLGTFTNGGANNGIIGFNPADFAFNGFFNGTPSVALDPSGDSLLLTFKPQLQTALTWTGAVSGSWNNAGNWNPAGVPSGNSDNQFTFGATPNAAMTNDIGPLALNSMTFTSAAPVYSLAGSGLNFQTSSTGVLPTITQNSANAVTIGVPVTLASNLTVGGTGSLALNGTVGGPGSLIVTGPGTVTLGNGANTYAGGTVVNSGTVVVPSDGALGTGNVTGSGGTVNFTGTTTTSKSFTMTNGTVAVAAGQTVTFNGGPVSGLTLDGAGTFATAAGGARFVNVATSASVSVVSNSAADQFVHVNNSGNLTVAPGLTGAGTNIDLNGFTNQGSGSVTVGAGSQINVANFQSYGVTTLAPGPVGQATRLTNLGTAPLGFNSGSRTFLATPATAGQNLALLDLHGHNAVVAGGLFVNNGFVGDSTGGGATIVADYGALVKGAGTFQSSVITQNGGKFQAGNSPGLTRLESLVMGPGGTSAFNWQINNATGTAGPSGNPVSGWSLLSAEMLVDPFTGVLSSGDLNWTATGVPGNQLNLSAQTLTNPTVPGNDVQGSMANFDPTQNYTWKLVQWQGNYTGPTTDQALNSTVLFDLSTFVNPRDPMGVVSLHYDGTNKSIDVVYAVPEPGTLALVGLGGLAAGWAARRKKLKAPLA
jgi:fibronectin-binding autotransporter adhesin